MVYGYKCSDCGGAKEASRSIEERDAKLLCDWCMTYTMKRLIGYGVQIVASPWYDKEGVSSDWPIGLSDKDKLEQRKTWDKENDASWDGKEPSKSDFKTSSAVDMYHDLTPDTVHRELASMAEGD